jgi:antitoxin component HigA of HigAB toxin-antitoxin module
MVHSDRVMVQEEEKFTKMIYGIKSEEIFQEAMSEFEDYYDFMKEVNKMVNESKETKYSVKQAIYIIENLYRMHEENGLNELIPKWNEALRDSMAVLNSTKEKTQTISDYIEYGNYLLSDTQVLTLNIIQ